MIKNYSLSKHRPITMKQIREEEAEVERRKQEAEQAPIKAAEEQLRENHVKLFEFGRNEVLAHRPDPEWELPASAVGLSMPQSEVNDFVTKEANKFVAENPDYFACQENYRAIMRYLSDQKTVLIPNVDVFKAAFERLSRLDLLVQKPEPKPEPEPALIEEPEQIEQEPAEGGLVAGFDLETGLPRQYSQKEIWKMSSADLKKAFKMWVTSDGEDRRPRINRSLHGNV